MAAMAGALGVQLEKIGHYRLGAPAPAPGPGEIAHSVAILVVACTLAALGAAALVTLHAPLR
jgi:adenosylcobinamide-phosphate synthase